MIRRLSLANWRAHERLDLELGPGTTFVVAPNGVGKTSIVEAATWALFAEHMPPPPGLVRAGADSATASVELELPDRGVLTVERTVSAPETRRAAVGAARLDGRTIPLPDVDGLLRHAFRADPRFLSRIAMPQPEPHLLPDGRGLREHLCQLFGVQNLNTALAELDIRIRDSDKRLRTAKQGLRADASRLDELRTDAARTAERFEAARVVHTQAREVVAAGELRAQRAHAAAEWQARQEARRAVLSAAAGQASEALGGEPQPEELLEVLAAALAAARDELDQTVRAIGSNDAQMTAVAEARRELDAAHADCPVCKRPLDSSTLEDAHAAHERDSRRLAKEAQVLRVTEQRQRALIAHLSALGARVATAPQPGPQPEAQGEDEPQRDVDQLREDEADALHTLVEATAANANARKEFAAALEDANAHEQLVGYFAEDAVLRAARAAVDRTIGAFVAETIGPIEAELAPRWGALFPGRGVVGIDGEGGLSRPVNDQGVPFSSFSGGEKIGALVLLRLLVAQMTTELNFCWFDEPLEHLDPATRRQVATLLTGAAQSYPLRQVVLTTYEESLAQRLAADSPGLARVVAVRPSRVASEAESPRSAGGATGAAQPKLGS